VKDSSHLLKTPRFDEKTHIIRDSETGRPILDGHIIEFKSCIYKGEEVKTPDWDVLELQWDLLRMACIAEPKYEEEDEDEEDEDEEDEEDDEDDDTEAATAAWLEGISDEYEEMEVDLALGFTTEEEEEMSSTDFSSPFRPPGGSLARRCLEGRPPRKRSTLR